VGFREVGPGCVELRGSQALAYVRSRSGYKFFDESKQKWVGDPTGDIGRINRQQDFLRRSMQRALDQASTNPATANALLNVALQRVITDDRITPRDLLTLAQAMRNLDTTGVKSYTIEWSMRRIGSESVLIPIINSDSMKQILSVFRGEAVVNRVAGDESSTSLSSIDGTAFLGTTQLVSTLLAVLAADDDTTTTTVPSVSPKQQRLGVFPPNDPSCR
jgi:anionic cell wall polymer biosynthesis LytR-Cps2A-Psr (LCP) family protein